MKHIKVCIPLQNPTLSLIKRAQKVGDLTELWIDNVPTNKVAGLIKTSSKPVVVSCKDTEERGDFKGTATERIERLSAAAQTGATYIDCGSHTPQREMIKLVKILSKTRAKLILSTHFWRSTPKIEELEAHALSLKKRGADIIKIAATIKQWSDTAILFELATRLKKRKLPFVVVGMGPYSKVSRIGCAVLGGEFTFVALDEKKKTAPGQLTIPEISQLMDS